MNEFEREIIRPVGDDHAHRATAIDFPANIASLYALAATCEARGINPEYLTDVIAPFESLDVAMAQAPGKPIGHGRPP
ncbi:MAG: hypothetical protein Q8O67_34355 [Deltaproteobacteria bacterium]|nr:hypothetical protein [Deltaproteobacteria bacterium]